MKIETYQMLEYLFTGIAALCILGAVLGFFL